MAVDKGPQDAKVVAAWHMHACQYAISGDGLLQQSPHLQANGRAGTDATTRLHVGHLTRNVTDDHVREIFSTFGTLKSVEVSIDKVNACMQCTTKCMLVPGPCDAEIMRSEHPLEGGMIPLFRLLSEEPSACMPGRMLGRYCL